MAADQRIEDHLLTNSKAKCGLESWYVIRKFAFLFEHDRYVLFDKTMLHVHLINK